MTPSDEDRRLLLRGLDGANPLGFLAAVGTLRTLDVAEPDARWRMSWVSTGGVWQPELLASRTLDSDELVEVLGCALHQEETPEFDFAKNLAVDPETFRDVARKARAAVSSNDRRFADFLAAFGCEVSVNGEIQDTAFRTMSGAGHQHFLGTMKALVGKTTNADLRETLFATWSYSQRKLGLRWDPEEDRRYALRWSNPSSGDGVPVVRGANRLAVEALPLFPTAPNGKRQETTGFTNRTFTWPIWGYPLCVDVVRSLFALKEMQASKPDRAYLRETGVVELYRSERINVGKYRNFSTAHPA